MMLHASDGKVKEREKLSGFTLVSFSLTHIQITYLSDDNQNE